MLRSGNSAMRWPCIHLMPRWTNVAADFGGSIDKFVKLWHEFLSVAAEGNEVSFEPSVIWSLNPYTNIVCVLWNVTNNPPDYTSLHISGQQFKCPILWELQISWGFFSFSMWILPVVGNDWTVKATNDCDDGLEWVLRTGEGNRCLAINFSRWLDKKGIETSRSQTY
jgi:hypothetical protein